MTKTERQAEGILKFLKANGIGTLYYVQRFGKTLTALKIAKRFNTKFKDESIYVVVPSITVKNVWLKEIEEFDYIFKSIIIITAYEAIKNKYVCGLLIIDEIHKFVSDERLKIIKGKVIASKYRLGLSGTYPHGNKVIEENFPIVDTITEKEALTNKWISQFREYNIPLELSEADKVEYVKYSTIMHQTFQEFKGMYKMLTFSDGNTICKDDLDLILSCYSGKSIKGYDYIKSTYIREAIAVKMGWTPTLQLDSDYHKQIEEYWNPLAIRDRVLSFYKAMRNREEIHNINEIKLDAVLKLYAKFKDDTILTFNESTLFADMLTDSINNTFQIDKAVSYHSNIKSKPLLNFVDGNYFCTNKGKVKKFGKDRQLKYIMSMIDIGLYNCINSVNALDEGLSVENINIIITTSGTTNPMQYSQRSARGKTVDSYNPDKVTLIFNLYFDDFLFLVDGNYKNFKSRDKTKLMLRTSNKNIPIIDLQRFVESD